MNLIETNKTGRQSLFLTPKWVSKKIVFLLIQEHFWPSKQNNHLQFTFL